jgi:hypothetical protein
LSQVLRRTSSSPSWPIALQVTLARRLHGLTPRSVLEKFAAVQMINVHLPITDGRELLLTRYTAPEPELSLLLKKLKLELPAQPPQTYRRRSCVADPAVVLPLRVGSGDLRSLRVLESAKFG